MTLLAADVPYQSILAVFGRVINEYKRASTTVNGIPGLQGEKHCVQPTVL